MNFCTFTCNKSYVLDFFFDIFDVHPKKYYGFITHDQFEIRPGFNHSFAKAKGKISPNKSEINLEIIGYNWFSTLIFITFIGFLIGSSVLLFVYDNSITLPIFVISIFCLFINYFGHIFKVASLEKSIVNDLAKFN